MSTYVYNEYYIIPFMSSIENLDRRLLNRIYSVLSYYDHTIRHIFELNRTLNSTFVLQQKNIDYHPAKHEREASKSLKTYSTITPIL